MGNKISRRSFLGGALLTGASIAGMGALSACSTEQAPGSSASDIAWGHEADMVVLGSGCAGMYAAIEAANQGLSVIVLEKQPEATAGGDSRCNAAFLPLVANDAKLTMESYSFGKASEDWAYDIEEEAGAAIDWLLDNGCEWLNKPEGFLKGYGPALYDTLLGALRATDATVMYETPATGLVQNSQGEVIGVLAENGGSAISVKAKKAVLVSTGSYTCNKDLMEEFHLPGLSYHSIGSPYLTGDGLIMACEVGAKLTRMAKSIEYGDLVSKPASEEFGTGIVTTIPPSPSLIWINGSGNRFMNETTYLVHNKTDLPLTRYTGSMTEYSNNKGRYENAEIYLICDEACLTSGSLGNTAATNSWATHLDDRRYIWSEDNLAEIEKGWIVKADTLEELADLINVEVTALRTTVENYNEGCASGIDEFDRPVKDLLPLGSGPYYATALAVGVIYSIGGITTDERSRTLNWKNEPIPRLYSAGNVGQTGPFLRPIGVPGCMAQGIIAALDIAALDAWE